MGEPAGIQGFAVHLGIRFEAGLATDRARPTSGGIALGLHHPRLIGEVSELAKIALRRGGEQERILQQKVPLQAGRRRRRFAGVLLGKYEVEVPEGGLVVFRPLKAKGVATVRVITRLGQSGHAPEDDPRIVFDKVGDKYIASEVWMPYSDGYLIAGSKEPHTHHSVKITKTT